MAGPICQTAPASELTLHLCATGKMKPEIKTR